MEVTINKLISEIEQQWLGLLYNHCRKTFEDCFIPSHDHYHHYRVWHFARQLFAALAEAGRAPSQEMIGQTIISVFFHDLGLSKTLEENHGAESRDMCVDFFRSNRLPWPGGFEEILRAIDQHDEKSVIHASPGAAAGDYDLLSILRTSDDLDAFGYIGIYRYAEIYMLRGIPDEILADRVLDNLMNRYGNFAGAFHELAEFAGQQEYRYRITRDFYAGLKEEFSGFHRQGYRLMILRLLREKICSRENLLALRLNKPFTDNNENIQEFFNLLRQENDAWSYPKADIPFFSGSRPA